MPKHCSLAAAGANQRACCHWHERSTARAQVIFDPRNLLACHDYKFIDLKPDPKNESCHSSYINVTGHDATAR